MARKRLAWAELRVGILVIFSFTILAVAIVLISGGAGFFISKYELKTYLASAEGLKKGSLVWLSGIEAGNVSAVNITSATESVRAVEVVMSIDRRYALRITEGSVASLGSIGLLGDKYIDISRGLPGTKPIPPGGEVKGSADADIRRIMQASNDLVANLSVLVNRIDDITKKIDEGQGTIGKFINDPSLFNKVNETVAEAQDLLGKIKSGDGTIGRLISDRELYNRLNGTLARVDAITAKVEKGDGTLGKFVHDPAVFNRADTLLAKFNVVADRMEKGEGFLGKLSKDDTLYVQLRESIGKFSALADKMSQGEGTIGKLMVDSTLYSNINQASGELVKLLYDFRQNPKRFLRFKFGLF